jgi:hypothetical protein
MVDATIVPVPKQRNSRDENDEVKAGKTPEAWEKNPAKNRQKDKDARWTKKHGKSFFGYKNHVNADAKHKLIRQYDVTDASVHDSQKFDGLLNQANTSSDVYADSAYRSAETEAKLSLRGLHSRIHHRANRNTPHSAIPGAGESEPPALLRAAPPLSLRIGTVTLAVDAACGFSRHAGLRSRRRPRSAGCRVGEDVAPLAPHRSGRADFPHPVPHARDSFQLV